MPIRIEHVDGNALVEQQDNQQDIPVECRDVKRIVALGIGDERIGAVLKQQVDSVIMAPLSCPLERRSDGITAFVVDLGAVLDEELAHGVLVVNGGPLCT